MKTPIKIHCWWVKRTRREQFITAFALGALYLWLLLRACLLFGGRLMALLLCGSLAFTPLMARGQERTAPVARDEPAKFTLLEGFCVGLIVGVSADVVIICAIKCHQARARTNSPPPYVTMPQTNQPPAKTNAVLRAGDAAVWSDSGDQFRTFLEYRTDEDSWKRVFQIDGTLEPNRLTVLISDSQGFPLATNSVIGQPPLFVPLPSLPPARAQFFRLSK